MNGKSVPGYPSLVVGLMTIGGVQLIMIGIVGEYIGKILSELKARPIYFVAEHGGKRIEAERDRGDSERLASRRMNDAAPRRIWLCADDYGISPGVNRAIRDLVDAAVWNPDFGNGGRPGPRSRRGRRAAHCGCEQPALRDRPAPDPDRTVPSPHHAFQADRRRPVFGFQDCCAPA